MRSDAVFLSASLPDPKRNPVYFGTVDLTATRDATRAVATVVLPRANLVFGGHPAITPLVRAIAERLGQTRRVKIYQSAFFANKFPKDNNAFKDLVIVPAVAGDREASLAAMRKRMLSDSHFLAAVFLGGMEGVEDEYELFVKLNPGVDAFPVGSTGAAAKLLLASHAQAFTTAQRHDLATELAYIPMFKRLLKFP